MEMKTISASSSFPFFTSVVASVTLLLVLVLTCSSVVGYQVDAGGRRRNPPPPPPVLPPPPPPFQFHGTYVLAIQWPRSICRVPAEVRKCDSNWPSRLPSRFTMHGLWPQIERNCTPPYYSQEMMTRDTSLKSKMSEKWFNARLDSSSMPGATEQRRIEAANNDFWRHEYNDHGACSGLGGQTNYFNKALDFYDAYNMTDLVLKLNFKKFGRLTGTVNQTMIGEAISMKWFGVGSKTICNRDNNGKLQLQEIRLKLKLNRTGHSVLLSGKRETNCTENRHEMQLVKFP